MKIDINCDLGEQFEFLENGHDEALMHYIFTANIACGKHAGDSYLMEQTLRKAKELKLNIGAHVGYDDRENFGRIDQYLSESEIKTLINSQLIELDSIAKKNNIELYHVKPHGALYNQSSKDAALAKSIAQSIKNFDPSLKLMGLAGSVSILEAEKIGLNTINEAFADRMYNKDGFLSSRKQIGSVINNKNKLKEQLNNLLKEGGVRTIDGNWLPIKAESICIHSDTPNSLEFAKEIFNFVNTYNSKI